MQTRKLGFTDMAFTEIGLGTWALGGGDWVYSWGPQDDAVSVRAIHRAVGLGVNWIDTAPVYGLGHAEEVVGRALRGISGRPHIATKCGLTWDTSGRITPNLRKESILKEADASLRRLGVEVIDLYQIHWPNPKDQIEEGWDAIARLIRAGKVRYGGVSNFSVKQMERIQKIHPVASLQPPYSMLRRQAEETMPFCGEHGIGIIVYSPMQKGLLTGTMSRARVAAFPQDDHRREDQMFVEPELTANLAFVDALRPIAERNGRTVAQLAIAWTLRRADVTGAIVGSRKPEQIEETVRAAGWRLSDPELEEIEGLLGKRLEALKRR
ncbi:MAG TPA: aldo/keto reductase [bacterium]|nr:aldo/keto reductase [bacterium]